MNVKRFTARTSRDALNLVRQAFGDDAVVLSTKPSAEGVEVLAMAPDGIQQIEKAAEQAPVMRAGRGGREAAAPRAPHETHASHGAHETHDLRDLRQPRDPRAQAQPAAAAAPARREADVDQDVERLAMSTLSFQDYVRERMLKRRQAELKPPAAEALSAPAVVDALGARLSAAARRAAPVLSDDVAEIVPATYAIEPPAGRRAAPLQGAGAHGARGGDARSPSADATLPRQGAHHDDGDRERPRLSQAQAAAAGHDTGTNTARRDAARRDDDHDTAARHALPRDSVAARREADMVSELRSMKGLIEERFGALAFMEKLQRSPKQAALTQKLLDCGFSPALIRKLGESLPADIGDETDWAASVLERNLQAAEHEPALEDTGGVYALIGSTGVGKTTSTAKIAAAFATKHGAAHLGLITLDAYRVAAHEQLRTYGRILGVPVHTAHDRASLEDLLDLLSAKKMVLIDTAGMAQRDTRTRELLEALSHRAIQKLLVVNAAAQGETIEDVMLSYRAAACRGVIVSKMDEAVKLGPALDALIRHKLKVVGIANGQRVPEDWHRLSAQALVQRALRASAAPSWRMDSSDVSLVFAGLHAERPAGAPLHA